MIHSFAWPSLIIAAFLGVLTRGRWNVPLAAWLAPIFLLNFTRSQAPLPGYLLAIAAYTLGIAVGFRGQVPMPLAGYAAFSVAMALILALPYLADRLWGASSPGFAGTLVFPLAVVVVEVAAAAFSPYGKWGMLAHTQYGNLPLMQLAAVAGTPGIAFLMSWFASVAAWAWGKGFSPSATGKGITLCLAVTALAFLAGGLRLAASPAAADTVRVAGITEPAQPPGRTVMDAFLLVMGSEPLDDARWETTIRLASAGILDGLFERSRREARAGARIVTWPEAAGLVAEEDEPEVLRRGSALAREEGIYLAMSLALVRRSARRFENKVVLLTPDGETAWVYHKRHPVPGPEANATLAGDSRLRVLETPFGRLGVAICFDADFPDIWKDLAVLRPDILLLPSSDWKEIDPHHSQMAVFEGVAHGMSVVRQARFGLSLATDPWGRVLSAVDYFRSPDPAMVAFVPIRGTDTPLSWGKRIFR